ncbi:MAG TPA: hypothetical protein VFR87_16185 [Nocardioidaceae bacterium]|nr:hypothetical protein [Nocardioidaceae bacterium]
MTAVAIAHGLDLLNHNPGAACGGNNHSWSNDGSWTPGCYVPGDQSTYGIMWKKPQEIANYSGYGYEIVAWSSSQITQQQALDLWKKSAAHNDVILNKGQWSNRVWKALGAIVNGNYACAWFGEQQG